MRDKIIRINWNNAIDIKDAIESESSNAQGLYYITRLFGENESSLYLGIATKNNTIRNRLRAHQNDWLKDYRGKIYVRIGQIIYPRKYDENIIHHAESAIIYQDSNVLFENTANRNSYTYTDLYQIENVGDIFELSSVIRMHEQE